MLAHQSIQPQRQSGMRLYYCILVLLIGQFTAQTTYATSPDTIPHSRPYSVAYATVTWVERDADEFTIINRNCIKLGQTDQEQDQWSTPVILHRSKKPLTSSSLVTLNDRLILFWTEQDADKTVIKYRSKGVDQSHWSGENTLHNQGSENIGINLLRQNNNLWAFWASTTSTLPDIEYSQFNAGRSLWSAPQKAHPENQVPDIQPSSYVNEQGNIVLNWLSYSLLQSSYVQAEKVFENTLDLSGLIDIIDVQNFTIPDFIPAGQAVTLRFPRNDFVQSRLVTDSAKRSQP